MEKIDRLGWAARMTIDAYGVRVGIRVNNSEVIDSLPDLLPPHAKCASSRQFERLYSLAVGGAGPNPNIRRFNVLYANTARIARTMDLAEAFEALESDLQLYVAEHARNRVFVHAGVVGWRGSAVIIPGASFTGKSTLVAALVRAGATYYSDEYAIFDRRGRVHPYPKPLSIRSGGHAPHGRFWPEELGGGCTGVQPLPVGSVVVTRYRSGARWRPRTLSSGQAVIALLAHTVSARRRPQQALTILSRAVSQAGARKGARGDAEEMIASLLQASGRPGAISGRATSERRPSQRCHA
jgi:hypothetical protein